MSTVLTILLLLTVAVVSIVARAITAMVAWNLFLVGRIPGLDLPALGVAPFFGACAVIAFLTNSQDGSASKSSGQIVVQCLHLTIGLLILLPVLWLVSRFL